MDKLIILKYVKCVKILSIFLNLWITKKTPKYFFYKNFENS